MQFNEKLTSLRKSMGLSQEELGAELKVSRQTISKWESAQSYPDFQRLVLLSDYFGLTLDELVRDVDVADVRAKNLSSEKLDSIYNDVGIAKKFIKWYLIIAGTGAVVVLFWCCCPLPCALSLFGSIQPKSPGGPNPKAFRGFLYIA